MIAAPSDLSQAWVAFDHDSGENQQKHAIGAATRLTITRAGAGDDVILIPGLASSAKVWDATVDWLRATHRVHVVQISGFAGEPAGGNSDGAILGPIVCALDDYSQSARLKAPAIIGHSMGGLLGLMFALRMGARIGKLMVVDTLPFAGLMMAPDATVETIAPIAAEMRNRIISQSQAAYAANARSSFPQLSNAQGEPAAVAAAASADSEHDVVARAVFDCLSTDVRYALPDLRQPLTVLYPWTEGRIMSASACDDLYASAYVATPELRLQRVDGSLHFIMLDQPDTFAAAVKAFLDE